MSEQDPISYTFETVPAVSTDQLRLAVTRALTAVGRGSASGPLNHRLYGSMTGEAAALMAAAISQAFPMEKPEDEDLLKGLIWRGIFALSDVVSDSRFMAFGESGDQHFHVGTSLMAAVAGMPMPFGGDVPVDAIYASACDADLRENAAKEMTIIIAPMHAEQTA